ncbi:ParB N-terminal domain-containing protein [Lysinibacillus sp. NPDC058147]|uniref:ParB N-terminal domain-containing protein n=1 Tax=unclassified Lysinibacillus TaxID=2636778 RepID=UPI0036DCBED0
MPVNTIPENILKTLKFIPVENICFHEKYNHRHIENIRSSLEMDGVLKNPPLALYIDNGKYLILDGAHRTSALKELGCKNILAQVVSTENLDSLKVETWYHLVPLGDWIQRLKESLKLKFGNESEDRQSIAKLYFSKNKQENIYGDKKDISLKKKIELWNLVVESYSKDCEVQRLKSLNNLNLQNDNMVVVSFPKVDINFMKTVGLENLLLPPGVTRCILSGRILNLNIPIELLKKAEPLDRDWDMLISRWSNSLRFYEEPVFIQEL